MSSRPRLFQLRCDRVYELARLGDQFTRSELAKVAAKFLDDGVFLKHTVPVQELRVIRRVRLSNHAERGFEHSAKPAIDLTVLIRFKIHGYA